MVRALGIGDQLTAVPALRALAAAFPDHDRALVTVPKLAGLAMLTGALHRVLPAAALSSGISALMEPDVCVNLHNNQPATYRLLLRTRPSRLIGFRHSAVPATKGFPVLVEEEHEVHRWCRLLDEVGIPADPTLLELPVPPRPVPNEARGATLLHPGASDPVRRWPLDRWVPVARAELDAGRRVLITGSTEEEDAARTIAERLGVDHTTTWAGGSDVLGLAALVAAAGRTVSGDTGLAHMATAFRVPSVVLFGPCHSPARWAPPPDRPWHRALWRGPDSGIDAITVDDVLAALDGLPAAAPR